MVIDIHCHWFRKPFMSESYRDLLAHFIAEEMGSLAGRPTTPEAVEQAVFPTWWDDSGETLIRRMEVAGIDQTLVLGEDVGLLAGEGAVSIDQQAAELAALVGKHPQRLLFCPNIDPRRPGALDLFDRCLSEWGARALKLYPPAGFDPDDPICIPYCERLVARDLPLLVHTGASYGYREGCHPARLERILAEFPRLTVVACHLGANWWRELIALGQVRSNLLTDFSGFQVGASGSYSMFCHILRRFLDEMGPDRILFGTDAPAFEHILAARDWVQLIRDLPRNSPEGVRFSEAEVTALLHDNAARVLVPGG